MDVFESEVRGHSWKYFTFRSNHRNSFTTGLENEKNTQNSPSWWNSLRIKILVVIDFFLQLWPFVVFKKLCKYHIFCLLHALLWNIGVITLSLKVNSDFTPIFSYLWFCPCFFKLKTKFAPIPFERLNKLDLAMKWQFCQSELVRHMFLCWAGPITCSVSFGGDSIECRHKYGE
jgi:hypothetical protein